MTERSKKNHRAKMRWRGKRGIQGEDRREKMFAKIIEQTFGGAKNQRALLVKKRIVK